ILGQSVVLPAARLLDARCAPKPGGSVEIKKASASAPRDLLEQQVTIEKHRLHAREERVAAVKVTPTCLDHSDFRVGEKVDRFVEQLWLRDKIGVENADEIAARRSESGFERAGFVTDAVGAVNQFHIEAARE